MNAPRRKDDKDLKTIIPKIVAGRKVREAFLLGKLLFWFGWTLACFAFVQCGLCRRHHPNYTVGQCLAPRVAKR